jgi:hypothetical protein
MPERQNVKRVASDAVQGEGSYVIVHSLTYAEVKALRKRIVDEGLSDTEAGELSVITAIVEWNWVDDDGQPLPQLRADPGVLEKLTDREVRFLAEAAMGPSPETLKN